MIKTRPVVLRGYDDAAVHGDRRGHIEVSFRWRHELPKALARFHVPATQRKLIVTHDLPPSAEFAADECSVSRGESRRGPARAARDAIQGRQRSVRAAGIHDEQIIHYERRGTHAPRRQLRLELTRQLPFPKHLAIRDVDTPQISERTEQICLAFVN